MFGLVILTTFVLALVMLKTRMMVVYMTPMRDRAEKKMKSQRGMPSSLVTSFGGSSVSIFGGMSDCFCKKIIN